MPSPTAKQLENKDSHNIIRVKHECRLNLVDKVFDFFSSGSGNATDEEEDISRGK